MTPAHRKRLRVALERETGLEWIHAAGWADYVDSHDWTVFRRVGEACIQRREVYGKAFRSPPTPPAAVGPSAWLPRWGG